MNKYGEKHRKLSNEIRNLVNEIQDLTGWGKETAIQWLKLNNLTFRGKSPMKLLMEGDGYKLRVYVKSRKLRGKKTV